MDLEKLQKQYPNIGKEELYELFPRIPLADYPELNGYSWEECHRGSLGGGALFLASEMAQRMKLEAGMRVLDLGCGHATSSMFLARHHGVTVIAADKGISPSGLFRVLDCQEHRKGREFWLDMIRWILEDSENRGESYPDFRLHDMVMLLTDQERFVTYFLLLAEYGR